MAKKAEDTTMLVVVGGIAILGLGAIVLFKDQILGKTPTPTPTPTPSPTEPPLEGEIEEEPPIHKPTTPPNKQLTVVEYKAGMDYYATRIAEELDKSAVRDLNRTTMLNAKANALLHYKSDLKKIVDLQNMTLGGGSTSLNESSLKVFATVLLKVAARMGIRLKPEAKARFEMQRAGKYKLLSQMAITLS